MEFSKDEITPEAIHQALFQLRQQIAFLGQRLADLSEGELSIWIPSGWRNPKLSPLEQLRAHLTTVVFQPGQDAKETTLLPGVVCVEENFMREIEQLNAAKRHFKLRMQFAKKTLGRSPYLSLVQQVVHPHSISLLQLYRDFRCFYPPVTEVQFSWVFKETATVKLSAQGAIKHIVEQIENQKIQKDLLAKVAKLGDVEFLYQRQIAPHLQANLKFETERPMAKKIHSPVFLLQKAFPILPNHDLPMEPTALIKPRAVRKDKKVWQRLYSGLNLYYAQ
ncbi:MAG: hypothetical protein JXR44_05900 [Thiotrichales bacterium]|nr:hypothetical protein [Thiotrichales bacterium]